MDLFLFSINVYYDDARASASELLKNGEKYFSRSEICYIKQQGERNRLLLKNFLCRVVVDSRSRRTGNEIVCANRRQLKFSLDLHTRRRRIIKRVHYPCLCGALAHARKEFLILTARCIFMVFYQILRSNFYSLPH